MNKHVKVSGCSRCPFASSTPQESNCELLAPDLTLLPREDGARLPNCPMLAGPVVMTYTTLEHDGKSDGPFDTLAHMGAELEKLIQSPTLGNIFKSDDADGTE